MLGTALVIIAMWNFVRFGNFFEIGRYGYMLNHRLFIYLILLVIIAGISAYLWYKQSPAVQGIQKYQLILTAVFAGAIVCYLLFHSRARYQMFALLFSPGKSILLFSPSLILSAVFCRKYFKRWPDEALLSLALFFLFLLLLPYTISIRAWQWGPRYYVTILPFLALPLFESMEQSAKNSGFKKMIIAMILFFGLLVQIAAVSMSYPDTFNYTAQKISADEGVELKSFHTEKEVVFPKLLWDWRYAPIKMQAAVLMSLLTKKTLPTLPESLAFKRNVKTPADWHFDFWWVYLYYYRMSLTR